MSLAGNLRKCAACGEVHYTGTPDECRRKLQKLTRPGPSPKPAKIEDEKPRVHRRPKLERVREIVDEDAKVIPVHFRISQSMSDWIDSVRGSTKRSAWIRDLIERERKGSS